ncbi:MAG: GTP-binding protein [Candidatus Jordarchaeaceae archaeon]
MASKTLGFVFKIVVLGDGAVGKTSLIKRWTEGSFRTDYILTIGSNFAVKSLNIEDKPIKLQIWDLAGQPHFSDVRVLFYKGAMGAMYVFDVSHLESYNNIVRWYEELKNICGDIPRVLLGNKVDLDQQRKVTPRDGEELAKKLGNIPYFETSAKTGQQVNEAFQKIAQLVYEWAKKKQSQST